MTNSNSTSTPTSTSDKQVPRTFAPVTKAQSPTTTTSSSSTSSANPSQVTTPVDTTTATSKSASHQYDINNSDEALTPNAQVVNAHKAQPDVVSEANSAATVANIVDTTSVTPIGAAVADSEELVAVEVSSPLGQELTSLETTSNTTKSTASSQDSTAVTGSTQATSSTATHTQNHQSSTSTASTVSKTTADTSDISDTTTDTANTNATTTASVAEATTTTLDTPNTLVASKPTTLTVGEKLQKARELHGLTINQVHDELRIHPRILKGFEQNIFEYDDYATVYVQAYLKKYAEFLKLNPTAICDQAFGARPKNVVRKIEVNSPTPRTVLASEALMRRGPSKVRMFWFLLMTFIIAAVLGYVITKSLYEDTQALTTDTSITAPANNLNLNNSVANTDNPTTVASPAEQASESATTPENSKQVATTTKDAPVAAPSEVVTPAKEVTKPVAETHSATSIANLATGVLETKVVNATDAPKDKLPAGVPATGLYFKVLAKNWIRVTNAAGTKTYIQKIFSAGDVFTMKQAQTYKLRIGDATKVELYYNGKKVVLPKVSGAINQIVGN